MAERPLVVYFKDAMYFDHARRIYIAARTKKRASEISGMAAGNFHRDFCKQWVAGATESPAFIQDEGVWLEIRDHNDHGHLESDGCYYGAARGKVYRAPQDEAAATAARTADEAHRKAFNQEALADLMKMTGLDEEQAKKVIVAVAMKRVRHIAIAY